MVLSDELAILASRETGIRRQLLSDAVIRLIEAQAAGSAADAGSTAAVEAASGALSRAFSAAKVLAPMWAAKWRLSGVSSSSWAGPDSAWRESMHRIDIDRMGMLRLIPVSSWHFEGSAHPDTWTVRASEYGPSTSVTRNLPYAAFVFVKWGSNARSTLYRRWPAIVGAHDCAVAVRG